MGTSSGHRALLIGLSLLVLLGLSAGIFWWATRPDRSGPQEVRVLAWVGYEENDFVSAFEADTGIKARVRTAAGGDAVMAIFASNPDSFDVVILDPEYIRTLAPQNKIRQLSVSEYAWDGYPRQVQAHPMIRFQGQLYGVPLRFGSNGLVFNTKYIKPADAQSYEVLWSPAIKGRIGIWDWYLPSMGVVSLACGNLKTPYAISDTQLDSVRDRLRALRPSVRAIHASPRDMLAALASEDTWIVPAGGEWIAGQLRGEGHPIDWAIPKEGGVMWMETALIPASSGVHLGSARAYIRWLQSPRAQALLAVRRAYYGTPCNANAVPLLPQGVRDVLHVASQEDLVRIFESLRVRELPQNQPPATWQRIWDEFKADSHH